MDIKKSIQEWFSGPQDYNEGIDLLQAVSKKAKVIGKLSKGESKTRKEKLAYELSKFIGLKAIPLPNFSKSGKKVKTKPERVPNKPKTAPVDNKFEARFNLIGKDETIDDYPEEIKKVINEYSSLYMQRSKNHKKMISLGDSNDAEIVNQRKDLADKIKEQAGRMESLFKIFSEYKNDGKIATGSHDEKTQQKGKETVEELKKLKKNLQASLAKDRNQLKFQNKTRPANAKDNPMPNGPKRIRLEKRIKLKEEEILDLDTRLAKLE